MQETIKKPAVQIGIASLLILIILMAFNGVQSSAMQRRLEEQQQQHAAELVAKDDEIRRKDAQIATDQSRISYLQRQVPPSVQGDNGNAFTSWTEDLFSKITNQLAKEGMRGLVKMIVKFLLHLVGVPQYVFGQEVDWWIDKAIDFVPM